MTVRIHRPNIPRRLVPLMDVLFLLLSFFIILPHGTRANRDAQAKPPDWSNKEIDRVVELWLGEDGRVVIDKNSYSIDELYGRSIVRADERALVLVHVAFGARNRDFKSLRQMLDTRKILHSILQEPRR